MATKKADETPSTTAEVKLDTDNPPVRDPLKVGVQAPESGPTGHTVVDATSPGPLGGGAGPAAEVDPKLAKLQEKAQAAAADEKADRTIRVRAKSRGYIGNKIREAGEVFFLALTAGEKLPTWVEAIPDENAATTPLSHSSEAQPEFVGADGIGKKIDSNDVL